MTCRDSATATTHVEVRTRSKRDASGTWTELLSTDFADFHGLRKTSVKQALEFRAAGRAREWNHVANVRDAGDEHQHPLETKTEAGMRDRSVPS